MKPTMSRDVSGTAIQALCPSGPTSSINTSGASASAALPAGLQEGEIVRVAATHDCYIKFGQSGLSATATDILMPAGVEYFVLPKNATHFAGLQVAEAGRLQIQEVS